MQTITAFLEQLLKLKVNVSKSAVARPCERKFLGYSMTWHKKPKLKIAPQSRSRWIIWPLDRPRRRGQLR